MEITVTCWNCKKEFDHEFRLKPEIIIGLQTADTLGEALPKPKTRLVPCPHCKTQNRVVM